MKVNFTVISDAGVKGKYAHAATAICCNSFKEIKYRESPAPTVPRKKGIDVGVSELFAVLRGFTTIHKVVKDSNTRTNIDFYTDSEEAMRYILSRGRKIHNAEGMSEYEIKMWESFNYIIAELHNPKKFKFHITSIGGKSAVAPMKIFKIHDTCHKICARENDKKILLNYNNRQEETYEKQITVVFVKNEKKKTIKYYAAGETLKSEDFYALKEKISSKNPKCEVTRIQNSLNVFAVNAMCESSTIGKYSFILKGSNRASPRQGSCIVDVSLPVMFPTDRFMST